MNLEDIKKEIETLKKGQKEQKKKNENLEQLREQDTKEIKELKEEQKKKNQEYDRLFEILYDFPVIAAQISYYAEEIEKLTKEISRYTKIRCKDMDELREKLKKKKEDFDRLILEISSVKMREFNLELKLMETKEKLEKARAKKQKSKLDERT
jgi:chromosome segregation ATPase